jgi:hypothetical protein
MREQVAGRASKREANPDPCRLRGNEIRKLALNVVSENPHDDSVQMSREALTKRAGERKWRPLL